MFAKSTLKAQSRRGNVFRASRQVSEPVAQFHWDRISILLPNSIARACCPIPLGSNLLQPSHSTSGSEAIPITNSRYSFFRNREMSLEQESLRRALRHSKKNSASPFDRQRPSASGFVTKREKATQILNTHIASPNRDRPKKVSFSVSHWFS